MSFEYIGSKISLITQTEIRYEGAHCCWPIHTFESFQIFSVRSLRTSFYTIRIQKSGDEQISEWQTLDGSNS